MSGRKIKIAFMNPAKMKLTPLSELVDDVWGPIGTPERDAMEAQLKEDLQAYYIGEAIKAERLKQNLTQEELGAKVGVKKLGIDGKVAL